MAATAAHVGGKRNPVAQPKLRLQSPDLLDQRTKASQRFRSIVASIVSDLGGDSELTEIERHLITSFAGSALMQGHLIAQLLAGKPVDTSEFANNASTLIRGAARLGTGRRAKDATPTLAQYLASKAEPAE